MAGTLDRRPWPGLIGFTVAFLSQWLGHSSFTLIKVIGGEWHYPLSLAVGLAGAAIIWKGLNKSELTATWMGFAGATLVWVGWFEFTFDFYSKFYAIPPHEAGPGMVSNGSANLLQSTLPILLGMFMVYGLFNRQTKCNLIRWVHRNLRLDPGMPTPDNGRSYARIAAMETIFVIWACYLFWLYVAYFGVTRTINLAAYGAWFAWFVYIFVRLLRIPRHAYALRYGIAVGGVGWGLIEMPSHFGMYPEVWLKPVDYPALTLVMAGIFAAGLAYFARQGGTRRAATAS